MEMQPSNVQQLRDATNVNMDQNNREMFLVASSCVQHTHTSLSVKEADWLLVNSWKNVICWRLGKMDEQDLRTEIRVILLLQANLLQQILFS